MTHAPITRLGSVGIRIPCNLRLAQLTCTCTWQAAAVFMVSGFIRLSQIAIEIEIVQIGNRNERGWKKGVLLLPKEPTNKERKSTWDRTHHHHRLRTLYSNYLLSTASSSISNVFADIPSPTNSRAKGLANLHSLFAVTQRTCLILLSLTPYICIVSFPSTPLAYRFHRFGEQYLLLSYPRCLFFIHISPPYLINFTQLVWFAVLFISPFSTPPWHWPYYLYYPRTLF